jgi:hypothetical protein
VSDAILYMLVDSTEKLKCMTVLDFPSNHITDESIGKLLHSRCCATVKIGLNS